MAENQHVVKPLFSAIYSTENPDSARQSPKEQEDRNCSVLPLVSSIHLTVGHAAVKGSDKLTACWLAGV